jgi:hypothetical protein
LRFKTGGKNPAEARKRPIAMENWQGAIQIMFIRLESSRLLG